MNLRSLRFLVRNLSILLALASIQPTFAQLQVPKDTVLKTVSSKWYDNINLRGYVQVRYNRLLETNPNLKCEQCDRSWGDGGGFFLRRIRLIFSGNIHPQVYFYIQPDLASSAATDNLHFAQIRDAYFDVSLDKKNEYRFRLGQSKIPYGFENMQSSQNRLPLDRNDALNSPLTNERDLGVFFYYAPANVRKLFASLVKDGLKGSGDYGVFAFGAFNGQTANRPEVNSSPHIVSRITYPFEVKNQIVEVSLQGYTGTFAIPTTQISDVAKVATTTDRSYTDKRVAATFVLYPKPFGIQAEYNVGKGPEFNKLTNAIETQNLKGGYATISYMKKVGKQIFIPFIRYQYYDGGKKHEADARSYEVKEFEMACEWQPNSNFELVAMYTMSNRRFEDYRKKENLQQGNLLRLQAQLNF
jgi:phosphate-selective porin